MMHIQTERLLLREFNDDDWRALYAYQNDPRFHEFYEWEHRSESDTRAFVQMCRDWQMQDPRFKYQLAIVLPATRRVIGNVGVRKRDVRAHQADLGYELDPREWGNGYAVEAANALIRFGFEQLRLHRIWARCIVNNQNSIRVLEKLGLRQEGHLRETEYLKGRYWDTLIYGILEDEWRWRIASAT